MSELADKINERYKTIKEEQPDNSEMYSKYQSDIEELKNKAKTKEDKLAVKELAEAVAGGVGNFISGAIGGSTIEAPKTDWGSKVGDVEKRLQSDISGLRDRLDREEKAKDKEAGLRDKAKSEIYKEEALDVNRKSAESLDSARKAMAADRDEKNSLKQQSIDNINKYNEAKIDISKKAEARKKDISESNKALAKAKVALDKEVNKQKAKYGEELLNLKKARQQLQEKGQEDTLELRKLQLEFNKDKYKMNREDKTNKWNAILDLKKRIAIEDERKNKELELIKSRELNIKSAFNSATATYKKDYLTELGRHNKIKEELAKYRSGMSEYDNKINQEYDKLDLYRGKKEIAKDYTIDAENRRDAKKLLSNITATSVNDREKENPKLIVARMTESAEQLAKLKGVNLPKEVIEEMQDKAMGYSFNVDTVEEREDYRKRLLDYIESNGGNPNTGKDNQNAPATFPMKIYKDGNEAQVNSEQELQEAISEGWSK